MITTQNRSIFQNFEDGADLLSTCKILFTHDTDVAYDVDSAANVFCNKTSNKYEIADVRRRIESFIESRCFDPVATPQEHIKRSYRPRSNSISRENAKLIKEICSTKIASHSTYPEVLKSIIKEFEEKQESHPYTEDQLMDYIKRYGKVQRKDRAFSNDFEVSTLDDFRNSQVSPISVSCIESGRLSLTPLSYIPTSISFKRDSSELEDQPPIKVAKTAFDPDDSEWKALIQASVDSTGVTWV